MKKTTIAIIIVLGLLIGGSVSAITVLKNQSQYLYTWTSSSPSRVMVDANTGFITPIWTGKADICAVLKSNPDVKFCHTVTVQ